MLQDTDDLPGPGFRFVSPLLQDAQITAGQMALNFPAVWCSHTAGLSDGWGNAAEAKEEDGPGRVGTLHRPIVLSMLPGQPGLISEPGLLCLGWEQARWRLVLEGRLERPKDQQHRVRPGHVWALEPTPTQKPLPQNTSILANRSYGGVFFVCLFCLL